MALIATDLRKRFVDVVALDGVSLTVEPGQVFGFLGPNGAGKTTTMRIMLDILHADAGSVTWNGLAAGSVPRRTWGYLPEDRGLYPRMRVLDQLVFLGSLQGLTRSEAARRGRHWLNRFRIGEHADRRADQLSKGNQQKVQFIAAILHDPEVLLMDEPFSGLDPINAAMLKEAFLELAGRGRAILFSTHQMEQVEELCQAVAIIDHGRMVESGPIDEVRRRSGRRIVRVAVSGDRDPAWADAIPGTVTRRSGEGELELELWEGAEPEDVLRLALGAGVHVTRFEIADPSIEEIFLERVGTTGREERQLAVGEEAVDR